MRLHIAHTTSYRYHRPVIFGRHRLVLRPREGHDLRVERMQIRLEPAHVILWTRDIFGNSIAMVEWLEPADALTIVNDVIVERLTPFPARELHQPWLVPLPPVYEPLESVVVQAYQPPSFPDSAAALRAWLARTLPIDGSDAEGTMLALCRLIFRTVKYQRRIEKGVQTPARTLELGTGSCRDMATLMMDAARSLGVAARFASGYFHCASSIAGQASTHAWAEVYLPTLGWRGFDPTIGAALTMRHIVTGVSSHPRGVMPVTGSFIGTSAEYKSLHVSVTTEELEPLTSSASV
jgi:transglutaminase-like putative cysteine protease